MTRKRRGRITWDLKMAKDYIEVESGSGVKLLCSSFKNTRSVLLLECPCGNEFKKSFTKFYHTKQQNCPECSWKSLGDVRRTTHEDYVKRVYEVHGDAYTVLGRYVRLKDKILVRHNSPTCDFREYEVAADSFLHGEKGCIECHYLSRRGSGNPSWNPDISDEHRERNRDYFEYSVWRRKVFERDNYTCKCCGLYGGKLNAHHILNFSKYKELRTDVTNGITLCVECHKGFHRKYGNRNNDGEQLREYLNDYKEIRETA